MKELQEKAKELNQLIGGAIATLKRGTSSIQTETILNDIEKYKKDLEIINQAISVLLGIN